MRYVAAHDHHRVNIHGGGHISGEIQVRPYQYCARFILLSRAFLHPFKKPLHWLQLVLFTLGLSVAVNVPKLLEFEVNLTNLAAWLRETFRAIQPTRVQLLQWRDSGRTRPTWSGQTTGTNCSYMGCFPSSCWLLQTSGTSSILGLKLDKLNLIIDFFNLLWDKRTKLK